MKLNLTLNDLVLKKFQKLSKTVDKINVDIYKEKYWKGKHLR